MYAVFLLAMFHLFRKGSLSALAEKKKMSAHFLKVSLKSWVLYRGVQHNITEARTLQTKLIFCLCLLNITA